ncbi:MAG: cell division protein FtsH [Dehalococcoidales bacterium]|nr:cell division protein FtsH [Dehalococcoidales bacterium]MDP6576903.1 ATP-dependent zinc metalloprotease FtsH [Dehalococcoidales bacterium]MDP6825230.1 ATP-dependent zinc metalloprotease FtsH [Dehalococcoidales bacterium]
MKPSWKRNGFIYVAILLAAVALFSYLLPSASKPEEVPLSDVIAMSQNKEIVKIEVEEDALLVAKKDGTELRTFKESNASIYEIEELNLQGVVVDIKGSSGINWGSLFLNFLPLIIFGGLLFFLFRQARGANSQAMSFGRSRARLFPASRTTVTFEDVAGVEEAKQDLCEVVDFLKSREKFQSLGARIPKGVLLIGPPGTGKTLMARAIAGEADVPFFSISGSEFVEMFVGVGASRVRDLFDQAKRNAPCIIFIDEIDAVGRHRGAGLGGSHDEREQTLNQILVEMDGFDTSTSVIVLAATNRPDILDPALLRPGRFDRRVVLDRPDISGRFAILKVHTNGKPLDKSVNLEVLAKGTVGFSGADLANLVNEAAILAARRDKAAISMQELEESVDRVLAGPERKSRKISPKEKEITAYHEAGHALVAWVLPNADPVHKISIVARGMSLGHTRQLPIEDRYLMTRAQIKDMIATFVGGFTAERLTFHEVTTGAQDDIRRATELARRMVTDFGMSDKLGPRTFGDRQEMVFLGREISEQKDYGDKIADVIDEEVSEIIRQAHQVARELLTKNKSKLVLLAKKLIAQETLEGKALEAVFQKASSRSARKGTVTIELAPVKPVAETEPEAKPGKASMVPRLVPKQAPAASD